MTKMKKLQQEYDRTMARMANLRNETNIAAANRVLDRIAAEIAELEGVENV